MQQTKENYERVRTAAVYAVRGDFTELNKLVNAGVIVSGGWAYTLILNVGALNCSASVIRLMVERFGADLNHDINDRRISILATVSSVYGLESDQQEVRKNCADLVEYLLIHGANPNCCDDGDMSALEKVLSKILRKSILGSFSSDNSRRGEQIYRTLLYRTYRPQLPWLDADLTPEEMKVVQSLVTYGADIDHRSHPDKLSCRELASVLGLNL